MKRASEKISDTIKSGKRPRRRGAKVVNLATIDMTDEERVQATIAARERVERLGYSTDAYGFVTRGGM